MRQLLVCASGPDKKIVSHRGSFSYSVVDGAESAEDATVYLVSDKRVLAAAEFDFGIDAWKVRSHDTK